MTGDTLIDYQHHADAPKEGSAKVWWRINGQWVHKGWLLPPLGGFNNE